MPGKRKKGRKTNANVTSYMAHLVDDLNEFEKFRKEILPMLRKDIEKGLEASEMYKKYQAHAAARGITIAMTSLKEANALAAIKDILDRSQGKAVEKKQVELKYAGLTDEELDAKVFSELQELEEVPDSFPDFDD